MRVNNVMNVRLTVACLLAYYQWGKVLQVSAMMDATKSFHVLQSTPYTHRSYTPIVGRFRTFEVSR